MHKRFGKWMVVGLVLLLGVSIGYQVISKPNYRQTATLPNTAEASAVLSDADRQKLAKQDRQVCLDIVMEETQKALAKADKLSDKTAAAQYKQKVLNDQTAQIKRCQVNYPED